ncbi:MAG: DNA mismatch repair protein MutS [Bacteriovoracaceae bacterium]|nr:DNA mismatch repair protein MutS [Bacteriovoracaceae bacterium]
MSQTLEKLVKSGVKLTPMMEQYYSIKKEYPDTIMFFRMGDFYEVFFEDAESAAKLLNIARTHRGKIGDTQIPMAGIPHHAANAYVDRLTALGMKVAICEQVQDPKDAKGIVKRAVTQVVSPGMPYDLSKTEGNEHRFMASALKTEDAWYLITVDFTTGEFTGTKILDFESLVDRLRMVHPREFITFMEQWEEYPQLDEVLEHMGTLKTYLSEEYFTPKYTEIYTEKLIPTFKRDNIIKADSDVLSPIGALSYYICSTQDTETFVHIKPFRMINTEGSLKVSLPTLTGLEILPKTRETYKESLLGFMDKTRTSLGARRLRTVFQNPLANLEDIQLRQNTVQYFLNNLETTESLRDTLNDIRDIERILAKISTNKANASDLLNLAEATSIYENLKGILAKLPKGSLRKVTPKELKSLTALKERIQITINDEIGASLDKGNLIKPGCDKKRDRLAKLTTNASGELDQLEIRYREETGIQKLRVKSNNVFGYFIEVSKSHTSKVPKDFTRRQTLVNCERYTTEELSVFEKEMISAKEKLERLERKIFKDIIAETASLSKEIQSLAEIFSMVDVYQSLAWIALQEDFSLPEISPDKKIVRIEGGWHPLIKAVIKDQFVSHDLTLDESCYFGLITGPNMAGKTTVMREIAIIQLLTQIGSLVPAKKVEIGLCDYLFSRLGASDDILKGQSTFMVEMAETAEILRHATDRSLIILDEVGRGTSTYDGLSIAWALVEHFIEKTKALCLFATHYHELIELVDKKKGGKNLTVETQNHDGDVQFLYRLIEQGASQSFGIYVAKLAGLPNSILSRSQEVLHNLESEDSQTITIREEATDAGVQLSIFGENKPPVPEHLQKIEGDLKKLDILKMTPLEAMGKLDELINTIQ